MLKKISLVLLLVCMSAHASEVSVEKFVGLTETQQVEILLGLSTKLLKKPEVIEPGHENCETTLKSVFDKLIDGDFANLKKAYDPACRHFDTFITDSLLHKLAAAVNKLRKEDRGLYYSAICHAIQLHCNTRKIIWNLPKNPTSENFSEFLTKELHRQKIGPAIYYKQEILRTRINFDNSEPFHHELKR